MSTDTSNKINVYCLAAFTDDEADEILTQLDDDSHHSYSAADVRVELIPWTEERDGGKQDIFRLFFEHQETEDDFMFFIDRNSLDLQDFLVADIRGAKKAFRMSTSATQWSVAESLRDAASPNQMQIFDSTQIVFGRCGREIGWYGNSYAGIKTIYTNLVSGRTTMETIVHKASAQPDQTSESYCISSVLDACDEAYSAQARDAKRQANLLSCELEVKSTDGADSETSPLSITSRNGRNSFCLSSSRWALQA